VRDGKRGMSGRRIAKKKCGTRSRIFGHDGGKI
jgi:hypothetical protein